jgi:HAD superfamily hydrolase (TIGR01509 family)
MLYPGVVQLLEYLKDNRVKSALCTLKIREATIRILEEFKIIDHFQMIITADDITLPKPNPEGIHKILNHLNVDKCKSVLIGDTVSDIMAGKNGQIETIGVAYGYESLEAIKNAKPGFIIGDLNELLEK